MYPGFRKGKDAGEGHGHDLVTAETVLYAVFFHYCADHTSLCLFPS